MASVKCPGCERVLGLKKLEAVEGFAACPDCSTVFDVSPEVESKSRRDAGYWSHGELPEPAGVKVVHPGVEVNLLLPKDIYRENARVDGGGDVLLLTYFSRRLFGFRVLGCILSLLFGVGGIVIARELSGAEAWMFVTLAIFAGGTFLLSFYFALVGLLNRVRIRIDGNSVLVDEGPLPCPHDKRKLSVAQIARVTSHYSRWTGRNGVRTFWRLSAWLRDGRQAILADDFRTPTVAMYLQRRIAIFLRLDSLGPVELMRKNESTDE